MRRASSEQLTIRHARVRAQCTELGLDALLVTHGPNVFYLSNHAGSAGALVLSPDAVHLLVDSRYSEAVRQTQESAAACPALRTWDVSGSYDEAVIECVRSLGAQRVGFEAEHLTVARFEWLETVAVRRDLGVEWRSTNEMLAVDRMIKDEHEVSLLRAAAAGLTGVAQDAYRAVRVGATERQVAGAIEASVRNAGFDRVAFDTIVASGPHAALPHHRAGDRRLASGDLVVLDFGGILDGYCSDLTRTVSVGQPAPEAERVYAAVRDAQEAAIAVIRPGVSTVEVDQAARSVLHARGLGEAFGHGTGHGLGLEVHELPRVARARPDTTGSEVRLQPGMVFTVEPGAYLPGWGGVRIEDDVLVTAEGCELLTSVSRDLVAL